MVSIRLHRPSALLVPTLALLLSALSPFDSGDVACAQTTAAYTWDTIGTDFADPRNIVTLRGTKDQVIFGRTSFAANRALLDNWYRNYLFPSMATEELLGELFDKRDNLTKDLENAADPALHQYLLEVAYEEATRRVTGNYHPYVRYNAMLIVGSLNQTEARMQGGLRYPAVRLPQAFDFMVDELKKPDQLDVVRVAAMLGIERHLRLVRQRSQDQPIPDGRRADVAAYMQQLLDQKVVPASRNVEGHTWLRRNAADVVAALGAVGDNRTIFDTLVRIVGDAEEPLSLRCSAARALGDLVYTDVTGIDAVATVRQLAALAAYACRTEDTRAKDEQKVVEERTGASRGGGGMAGMGGYMGMAGMAGSGAAGIAGMAGSAPPSDVAGAGGVGGAGGPPMMGGYPGMPTPGIAGMAPGGGGSKFGPGGMMPGMYGLGGASPVDQEMEDLIDRVRRRLKLPLHCVLLGIRGQQAGRTPSDALGAVAQLAVDDGQKAEITRIVKALDSVVVATDAHEKGLAEMLKQVRTKVRDLESLLPNVTPAAVEPSADEALPGGGGAAGDAATEGSNEAAAAKAETNQQ